MQRVTVLRAFYLPVLLVNGGGMCDVVVMQYTKDLDTFALLLPYTCGTT